ncbi:hypothetical protein L5B71_02615 [Avibacterium sp. 21-586]|uniref:hypothetical protein n=1 Tax=Avibacterium sp. 21-586 TaxID=2911534 RepID=UPI002245755A|nr:hypothetical protein [Avibacterium sp. 21-586]MCW9709786.1 hypothetical protein [Avibacterium sp. 21-586]
MKPLILTAITLCLSACYHNAPSQTASPSTPSSPTISATTAPTATQTEIATKAYDGPVKSFTAFGNSPAPWRAVVVGNAEENGNTLSLEGDLPVSQIEARRLAYARGVEFYGNVQGKEVVLNIRTQKCIEQGKAYPFTAKIRYGNKSYKGCALPQAIAHSPT